MEGLNFSCMKGKGAVLAVFLTCHREDFYFTGIKSCCKPGMQTLKSDPLLVDWSQSWGTSWKLTSNRFVSWYFYWWLKAVFVHFQEKKQRCRKETVLHPCFILAELKYILFLSFQYYLDLTVPYIKMSPEDGAVGEDGYLRMSSTPDYTQMSPTSTTGPPLATLDDDIEDGDLSGQPHYMNQRAFPREKGSEVEMQPLIRPISHERRSSIPDEMAPGFVKRESPRQVRTLAEVHQPDDSDSGHSSSYAPGTSPTDNAGYLLPKSFESTGSSSGSQETRSSQGRSREHKDLGVVLSPTDSVFSPDYHLNSYPPPDYRLVVEEEGGERELPV